MNNVLMIGQVFQDSDIFTTTSGKQYVNLKISINRGKDENGNWLSDIFTIQYWNKTANYINQWVHKGDIVSIEGHLAIKKTVDKETNQNRYVYYIVGSKITKLSNYKSKTTSNDQNNNKPESVTMDDISQAVMDLPFGD